VALFEPAAARAAQVLAGVRPEQLDGPPPCLEWSVQQLVEHTVDPRTTCSARRAGRRPGDPSLRRSRTTDRVWRRCSMHSHAREPCGGGAGHRWTSSGRWRRRPQAPSSTTWCAPGTSRPRPDRTGRSTMSWCGRAWRCSCLPCPSVDGPQASSGPRSRCHRTPRRRTGCWERWAVSRDRSLRRGAAGDRAPGQADDAAAGVGRRAAASELGRGGRADATRGEPAPQAVARGGTGVGAGGGRNQQDSTDGLRTQDVADPADLRPAPPTEQARSNQRVDNRSADQASRHTTDHFYRPLAGPGSQDPVTCRHSRSALGSSPRGRRRVVRHPHHKHAGNVARVNSGGRVRARVRPDEVEDDRREPADGCFPFRS
jgi:hypothetical protein